MADPIRVLIADDQDLLRGSFRLLIDSDPGLTTVGQGGTGREAIDLALALAPDIVLMDVRMPDMDGLAATRTICSATTTTRIIILTTFDLDEYVYGALQAGASGFLLKNSPPEELLRAIHVVAEGNALLAPEVTRRLIADVVQTGRWAIHPRASLPALTPRETDVIALVAQGLSNDDIAEHLFLSRATVKTYVSRLLSKLDARDRTQLVVLAYESGLVVPPGRDRVSHVRDGEPTSPQVDRRMSP